jgi:hypothetical protein
LNFLDKDAPDERRFSILKKIFIVAATEKVTKRESVLPQEYMKICRGLSAGEIIVLNTAYRRYKTISPNEDTSKSALDWITTIANVSDLHYTELVETYEQTLMKKHLLSSRQFSDGSGVKVTPYYRLTELAYDICQYIENYDSPEENSP